LVGQAFVSFKSLFSVLLKSEPELEKESEKHTLVVPVEAKKLRLDEEVEVVVDDREFMTPSNVADGVRLVRTRQRGESCVRGGRCSETEQHSNGH